MSRIVAISANDAVNYPNDAPDQLKKMAEESGFNFPFLYDETQEVLKYEEKMKEWGLKSSQESPSWGNC